MRATDWNSGSRKDTGTRSPRKPTGVPVSRFFRLAFSESPDVLGCWISLVEIAWHAGFFCARGVMQACM